MQEVQALQFTEDPNYDQLKKYLKDLMKGEDIYLDMIKKQIRTRVYQKNYERKFAEVTNVVAMKKRK